MRHDPWNLQEMLEPVVEAMGYELLGVDYQGRGAHGILRIYIDKPEGITLDDCSAVSHQVSGTLDVEDPIPGQYSLEVSSPGLDRPLFKLSHFEQFVGARAKLKLVAPLNGQRNFVGTLQGVEDESVLLLLESGTQENFFFKDIEQARLVPDVK